MNRKSFLLKGLLALIMASSAVMAQDQDRQQVYGSQLMTEQERNEHQEKLRNAKTEQEREAYRSRHQEEMKQRAREQGVEMPNDAIGKERGKGAGYKAVPPMDGSRGGSGSGGGKGK